MQAQPIDFSSPEYTTYVKDVRSDSLGMTASILYLPPLLEWIDGIDWKVISILEIGASIFNAYDWFMEKFGRPIDGMDFAEYLLKHQNGSVHCKPWSEEKKSHFKCPVDAHKLLEHYLPNSYDLILAFHSFEHMLNLPIVLRNCFLALKNGGHLFCSLPCPSINFHKGHWYDVPSVEAMQKLLENAGFRWIRGEAFPPLKFRPENEMICLATK